METGKIFDSAELIEKLARALEVSVSALFYTVQEKSFDSSDFRKIEKIIEEESQKAFLEIKNESERNGNNPSSRFFAKKLLIFSKFSNFLQKKCMI